MGRIVYSPEIGFVMSDWENESIRKVYAGTNCIMAITDDGRVLQKVTDEKYGARTKYWTRIRQIAVSKWWAGAAIGLVSDGTCLIAKRPIRSGPEGARYSFDQINETVKSWHDIVQVAVSDAFFALDSTGRVHCSHFSQRLQDEDDYREVICWENVAKIVPGVQNSLFGVTKDGKILCAGLNTGERGPNGDLNKKLAHITDAVDVFPTGSECEKIVIGRRDGTLVDQRGSLLPETNGVGKGAPITLKVPADPLDQVLEGSYQAVIGRTPTGTLFSVIDNAGLNLEAVLSQVPNTRISSFAVGEYDYRYPFFIAVTDTEPLRSPFRK